METKYASIVRNEASELAGRRGIKWHRTPSGSPLLERREYLSQEPSVSDRWHSLQFPIYTMALTYNDDPENLH